jgi:PAS domain S-box-containing protein
VNSSPPIPSNSPSDKLFRALIDQSDDTIEVVDPETGRFLDVNQMAWQRLGYSREEMLSMKLSDVSVTAPCMPDIVEEIRRIGFKIVEGRHRRKDGSTFPIEANVQYIQLDRGYLIAVVRDIRARNSSRINGWLVYS